MNPTRRHILVRWLLVLFVVAWPIAFLHWLTEGMFIQILGTPADRIVRGVCVSLLLLAVSRPFVLALIRHAVNARRIARQNRCPTCSYDLRAHAPGQSCPECGTPVPPRSAIISGQRSTP
jgi:hypothetical protein